jgi:cytochrome c553
MNKAIAVMALSIIFTGAIGLSQAAGNARAGKTKTTSCAGCHGDDGNSIAPIFPKLAGQHASYLAKQLYDFKNHSRGNQSMEAIAAPLSDQDIEDIGAFYATQKISFQNKDGDRYLDADKEVQVTEELSNAGKTLYLSGNAETGVPACSACHGPTGAGNAPAGFPALKGQFGAYAAKTLSDYKSGARTSDPESMMQTIAKRMTENEINAVSAHIANLR